MILKRWEPLVELRRMDTEMDRIRRHMFRPTYLWPRFLPRDGQVAIDVYWDADNLVVRAALPGVKPEEAEVTFADSTLTISGEIKLEKEVKEEEYLHRERRSGNFRRVVALPQGLDTERAEASYDNGILTVTIPKTEESKPKSLKINVKSAGGNKS